MIEHIRAWNKWRKGNRNNLLHKILVLFKLIKSPTFETGKHFYQL